MAVNKSRTTPPSTSEFIWKAHQVKNSWYSERLTSHLQHLTNNIPKILAEIIIHANNKCQMPEKNWPSWQTRALCRRPRRGVCERPPALESRKRWSLMIILLPRWNDAGNTNKPDGSSPGRTHIPAASITCSKDASAYWALMTSAGPTAAMSPSLYTQTQYIAIIIDTTLRLMETNSKQVASQQSKSKNTRYPEVTIVIQICFNFPR